jgi:E3 ubiquitin-protein ligase BIG BROTHER-like protein
VLEGDSGDIDVDAMSYDELLALGEVLGSVSTGIDVAAATVSGALPAPVTFALYKMNAAAAGQGDIDDMCVICQEAYDDADDADADADTADLLVQVLPCHHSYHSGCITQWLRSSSACPVCKADVREGGETGSSSNSGGVEAMEV